MRTLALSRSQLLLPVALLAVCVLGCSDDDPVDPGGNPGETVDTLWVEVELPEELPDGTLSAIAMRNNSSAVVGASVDGAGILLENTSRGWREVELGLVASSYLFDVAIDAFGRRVIAGATPVGMSVEGVVIAERPDWASVFGASPPAAVFQAIAVDDTDQFLAVGNKLITLAGWTGSAEGSWSEVLIPAPGDPQEKALVDVAFGDGAWVACGFDDGGEGTVAQPYSILMIDEGSGWELIDVPCGGCGNTEYMSVAINDQGAIFLGGATTDFSGGNSQYKAFLRLYSRNTKDWVEIVIPDADGLERVNEILISAEGDIYLACGESNAALVRLPAMESSANPDNIEWRASDARLYGLAQANSGRLYAVGESHSTGASRPLMLERPPTP